MAADFTGRIDQMDALDLDNELKQHFSTQLKDVSLGKNQNIYNSTYFLMYFQAVKYLPEELLVKIMPELDAILQFALYYMTLYKNGSTTGQQLLGLQFKVRLWCLENKQML